MARPWARSPPIEPGASGGATITFEEAGAYTYQCILVDAATGKPHDELGMTGTMTVTDAP